MKNNKIVLTEVQRKALNKLWFLYGNHGKKSTHSNHRFIQNILQHGEDDREPCSMIEYKILEQWEDIILVFDKEGRLNFVNSEEQENLLRIDFGYNNKNQKADFLDDLYGNK